MLSAAIMGPWFDCSRTRLEPMASAEHSARLSNLLCFSSPMQA